MFERARIPTGEHRAGAADLHRNESRLTGQPELPAASRQRAGEIHRDDLHRLELPERGRRLRRRVELWQQRDPGSRRGQHDDHLLRDRDARGLCLDLLQLFDLLPGGHFPRTARWGWWGRHDGRSARQASAAAAADDPRRHRQRYDAADRRQRPGRQDGADLRQFRLQGTGAGEGHGRPAAGRHPGADRPQHDDRLLRQGDRRRRPRIGLLARARDLHRRLDRAEDEDHGRARRQDPEAQGRLPLRRHHRRPRHQLPLQSRPQALEALPRAAEAEEARPQAPHPSGQGLRRRRQS